MRVTGLALTAPAGAATAPALTPELLASVLARYSRSNAGLDAILASIEGRDPEEAVDAVLRFIDYGHASIGGLTGGIAMAIDDVSMWLAYRCFALAQMADGQESSTRYLRLDAGALPDPGDLGVPAEHQGEWRAVHAAGFEAYARELERLDALARAEPERVRVPDGVKPAAAERMRRNYALDRARYFLPLATRTNLALVMSARSWADLIRQLASAPQIEAVALATRLASELARFAPRLVRHATASAASERIESAELAASLEWGRRLGARSGQVADEVWLHVDRAAPPFYPNGGDAGEAVRHRENRYGRVGSALARMTVSVAWNNMAVAEIRDLNRHRVGRRHSPLVQHGLYLPTEIDRTTWQPLLDRQARLVDALVRSGSPSYVTALWLGTQTPYEHRLPGDVFPYLAELRTGTGAHYRYAEHLRAALAEFHRQLPETQPWVRAGTAEPE